MKSEVNHMKVDFASVDTIPIPENTEAIILQSVAGPSRDREQPPLSGHTLQHVFAPVFEPNA
jgi:hypothetical protein